MMSDHDRLAKALLTTCPVPPRTRDWDALTEAERNAWVWHAVTVWRVHHELQQEDFRRDVAEALAPAATTDPHLRWGEGRVDGLDPEERADILAQAFAQYARHLEGCTRAPCSCGLAALLGDAP